MPTTPTREQFNAAAKAVTASAPSGLSRDDFYSLVDKELAGATAPTAEEMLTHRGKMSPQYMPQESEPDTWMGGFIRGLRREFVDPLVKSDVAKSAAEPKTTGDLLQLLVPSALGMGSAREFIPAAKNLAEGASEGAAEREGLKKIPAVIKGMWKRATTVKPSVHIGNEERRWYSEGHVRPDTTSVPDGGIPTGELPTSSASEIDHYLPNKSGVPDNGISQGELPTSSASEVDAHLPNQSGYTPGSASRNTTLRVGEPAPIELDNIQDVLMRDATSKADAAVQTDRVPYGGVEVPYKVKKTRMGKEVANPYGKDEVAPTIDDEAPVQAGATPTVDDVTVTSDKPRLSSSEVADHLRRMYGSRDGGRMLNGADPKGGAEALKRLAPGPSRIPLVAEARINGMPQDQTLEDALREIIINRSKLPPE